MSDQYVQPRLLPSAIFTPASLHTNGFTIGRLYKVVQTHEPGRAVTVSNDKGYLRTVVPDGSACAHIVSKFTRDRWERQVPVGCFVYVKKFDETHKWDPAELDKPWRDYHGNLQTHSMSWCKCGRPWNQHECVSGYCPTPENKGL
jgi:hypothetical protein